jgi:hypothetical protein
MVALKASFHVGDFTIWEKGGGCYNIMPNLFNCHQQNFENKNSKVLWLAIAWKKRNPKFENLTIKL